MCFVVVDIDLIWANLGGVFVARFREFGNKEERWVVRQPVENPVINYEIQETVERMVALQMLLDDRAHNFLARFAEDEVFAGVLDADEEWRCWLEGDKENSCLFFDETLEGLDDKAYDHFLVHYGEERKAIGDELAAVGRLGKGIDEFQVFKTGLYNVFNNKNGLSVRDYFNQVYSRAKDYHMTLERHSKEDLDFVVSFCPLDEVNRDKAFYEYQVYMEYHPGHSKDGYVYAAKILDARSADASFSGPVVLPVHGQFAEFERALNDYFLGDQASVFYHDALKAQRIAEKEKYNIPADYFEGTYIDTSKLRDFSDKSFQYGNSKIFIPKSQVAFAGEHQEKIYMKRWLYARLKNQIEALDKNVGVVISEAEQRSCTESERGTRKAERGIREGMSK